MKYLLTIVLTLGFLNNIQSQESSDKIIGIWFNEDKTSKVEIYKEGNFYLGKVIWISELERNPKLQPKDKNNPKSQLRNRNILGLDILTGLQYVNGKWINGTIYSPKRGIYADCKIEFVSNSQLKVIVSKSGFTKTQKWTR